ncbi:MAG: hypothetical protein J7J94_01415, partial [Thaumarchaeota archaeon]|nr:hypothetical protein [Nitrososphaerota archaeon]
FTAIFGSGVELILPLAAISAATTYIAAVALQGVPIVMLSPKTRRILPAQLAIIALTLAFTVPFRQPLPQAPWIFLGSGIALVALSIPASLEVRRAIGEMEGGHLLAQGLATKIELGYPIQRSFQMVKDGRVAEQIRRVSVGVETDPRSRQLQLVLSTIKVVKESGAGAKALEVVARTAQRLYHAYREMRGRLRLYEVISIGAGPVVLLMSYAITRPLKEFAGRYAASTPTGVPGGAVQAAPFLFGSITLSGLGAILLPVSVILSLILGLAVSKLCDHTVATTWRAGIGVIAATLIYLALKPYW